MTYYDKTPVDLASEIAYNLPMMKNTIPSQTTTYLVVDAVHGKPLSYCYAYKTKRAADRCAKDMNWSCGASRHGKIRYVVKKVGRWLEVDLCQPKVNNL